MTDATGTTEQVGTLQLTVDHLNNGVLLLSQDGQMLEPTFPSIPEQPLRVLTLGSEFIITQFKESSGFSNGGNGVILKLNPENVVEPEKDTDLDTSSQEAKRPRLSDDDDSVQQLLSSIEQSLLQRLDCLERKLESVTQLCNSVQEKVEGVVSEVRDMGLTARLALASDNKNQGTIIFGAPSNSSGSNPSRSNGRLVLLSSESDYPNGSWLGDPNNQEARVRCHLPERELERINQTCPTPEKMALTLLDYLFDRETQACSNISGTGRHGKKQLDPLKVYGIRCHLVHRFQITERDWHRIKQNLDSKCRTAFRRKQRGMPLTVKKFREILPTSYLQNVDGAESSSNSSPATKGQEQEQDSPLQAVNGFEIIRDVDSQEIGISHDLDLSSAVPIALHTAQGTAVSLPLRQLTSASRVSKVIHTEHGDIEVVHATPEELMQMQQTHQIQILTGTEVLGELQDHATAGGRGGGLLQGHA